MQNGRHHTWRPHLKIAATFQLGKRRPHRSTETIRRHRRLDVLFDIRKTKGVYLEPRTQYDLFAEQIGYANYKTPVSCRR